MAKVTVKTEKVPVTTYKDQTTYTLELTTEEAQVILALTGASSGSSLTSPRKFTNRVYSALLGVIPDAVYHDPFYDALITKPKFKNESLTSEQSKA